MSQACANTGGRRVLCGGLLVLAASARLSTGVEAQGAKASCTADFEYIHAAISQDYAGYPDRLRESASTIGLLTDSVRAATVQAPSDSVCTALLQRWLAPFSAHDRHLQLWQPRVGPAAAGASGGGVAQGRPSVALPDDSTVVLTLPSFNERYKPTIDSLIGAHWNRLLASPFLVIDVRDNGGGATRSYAALLPLLYTNVIPRDGMDFWVSERNLAMVRATATDAGAPPGLRAQAAKLLPGMEKSVGRFFAMGDADSLRFDTVHVAPRAVAVLTGAGCASSCEQFVLDALHSTKVVVMGVQPTAGFLDYGNVLTVTPPAGIRRLAYATSRSRRLPARPMDHTGIVPQVLIPREEADRVAFATRYLKGRR